MTLQSANQEIISLVVDKHLALWADDVLNRIYTKGEAEPEMIRSFHDTATGEEYDIWIPIPTQIKEQEIDEVEEVLKHALPESYRFFLQYKFFFDLYIDQLNVRNHTPSRWKKELVDRVLDGYPEEFLIDKGYLAFADYSDWGHLCFDTNRSKPGNEYPVVLWDHDSPQDVTLMADSFTEMLQLLSAADDKNRQQNEQE
ncbi:SMI1/KNR4 family protein [Hymenobacter psychrophilus]|uniref:SMI1-KNR4 cell-wall n=1 Tax=Hymenobacter psychrophilus TaxID=651662 RepID=A0A1H3IPZ7_9BACT|nr:SMI1/KNR4 family protein [Hymenobacter psychrophilus]SDY29339.1 SMI1-KNR4 cell-wall [Hymenobacter psychrophilus]